VRLEEEVGIAVSVDVLVVDEECERLLVSEKVALDVTDSVGDCDSVKVGDDDVVGVGTVFVFGVILSVSVLVADDVWLRVVVREVDELAVSVPVSVEDSDAVTDLVRERLRVSVTVCDFVGDREEVKLSD
jgi:hypothetical protein